MCYILPVTLFHGNIGALPGSNLQGTAIHHLRRCSGAAVVVGGGGGQNLIWKVAADTLGTQCHSWKVLFQGCHQGHQLGIYEELQRKYRTVAASTI